MVYDMQQDVFPNARDNDKKVSYMYMYGTCMYMYGLFERGVRLAIISTLCTFKLEN